ncbi:MAG: radical SAM protein [Acidobacteriia bacterium]|nr:radical SAM protein [Terriglobia bacterium]
MDAGATGSSPRSRPHPSASRARYNRPVALLDAFARPLRNLRLSVTDRCNLRCEYCMPEDDYVWLPREDVLHFEETSALVDVSALVKMIAAKPGLKDLALTTNGVLLADQIDALKAAGLGRVTVSLDTLRPDRFVTLTRFDQLDAVHAGIASARRVFGRLKLDTVVIRGVNDDELVDLIEYGRAVHGEVRFIEYMDVGGASRWSPDRVVSRREMLEGLTRRYGPVTPIVHESSAPAEQFTLSDGTVFGIIASTTEPFCRSCDRSRLTADGMWYLCLYAMRGLDLRAPLRQGASVDALKELVASGWQARDDRGAENRLALGPQRAFVPVQDLLRKDPHLEMHTRGG